MIKTTSLATLRDQGALRTGALVFFNGCSGFSELVETLSHSCYSHCAMIVQPRAADGTTVLTESAAHGVALSTLDDYIAGDTYRSIMILNPLQTIRPEQIMQVYEQWKGTPYPTNLAAAYITAILKHETGVDECRTFFCSEWVTKVLCVLHEWDAPLQPNEYTPQDLTHLAIYDPVPIGVTVPPISLAGRILDWFRMC